jgi:hypothetical protein
VQNANRSIIAGWGAAGYHAALTLFPIFITCFITPFITSLFRTHQFFALMAPANTE